MKIMIEYELVIAPYSRNIIGNSSLIAGKSQEDNQHRSPQGNVQRLVERRKTKWSEMGATPTEISG